VSHQLPLNNGLFAIFNSAANTGRKIKSVQLSRTVGVAVPVAAAIRASLHPERAALDGVDVDNALAIARHRQLRLVSLNQQSPHVVLLSLFATRRRRPGSSPDRRGRLSRGYRVGLGLGRFGLHTPPGQPPRSVAATAGSSSVSSFWNDTGQHHKAINSTIHRMTGLLS
jgi:hypothetical protein